MAEQGVDEQQRTSSDEVEEQDGRHAVSDDDATLRRVRRGSGARARARRKQQREQRIRLLRRGLLGLLLAIALAVAGWALVRHGLPLLGGDDEPAAPVDDPATDDAAPAADDTRPTLLVATFDDNGEEVLGVQLLTLDAETGRGGVVLVPTEMVADVPGYGLLPLGDAGAFGGVPLVELTVENQLGIAVDATVRVTEQDWAALFTRTGGFEVDVARPLTAAGSEQRRFEPGPQFLDGPRLAEYLTIEVAGEDELTSFARIGQVLQGFLATGAESLDELFADDAPMLATQDLDTVERTLRGLAGDDVDERVALRTLPVTLMGSGDGTFYRLDEERAAALVGEVLGGTEEVTAAAGDGVELEILNGNGRAGIGADVASLLVPLGHTVAITRNAEDFDHPTTRVLLHRDDDELVAAAQEIVDELGVGRVELSDVPSSIVDITVLVGADFRR